MAHSARDLARDVIKKLKLGEPGIRSVLRGTSLVKVILIHLGIVGSDGANPEERVLRSY